MFSWISLSHFRSYDELRWSPDPGVNILVGDNGAGKTNLLEALTYLATLRSFRRAPDEALIHESEASAVVRGEVLRGESNALIEVEINHKGRRRVRLDQKTLNRRAELLGVVRVVTFLPEDLDLIKGSPGGRREMLDEVAVQLWPAADLDQSEYERALRQRNSFLRAGSRDEATLEVWDSRLAQAAGRVMARRARAVQELVSSLSVTYAQVAGYPSEVSVQYESEWGGTADPTTPPAEWATALLEVLQRRRRPDWELGVTGAGPHRDDLLFTIDGHPARFQASQGEQRTLALSVRLATHAVVNRLTASNPVLILDDVFSELDPQRASHLTAALPSSQTMITTTHPEEIPVPGKTWHVEAGVIR
jgi:DNA replication and repair protein RecF